ncbi:MAG: helix-turn-helix domain-containing protein [Actinomycetota bacterium]|nr:helix-turn-helix domain-containing protein [Actinomycetota bacterium]MDP2286961.1 helix-turn-helix domain-containing protein [Actinomycetota bacterium]
MSALALAPQAAGQGLSRSLFTAEEVALALAVSETLVRQLTLSGDIPCRRIGRLVRYAQADVDAFVSRCDERGY